MTLQFQGTAPESRRKFLGTSARLAAGGAAAVTLSAQTDQTPSDLALLNFALAFEQLESAFYTQGLERFRATDFTGSSLLSGLGTGVVSDVFDFITAAGAHQRAHVTALQAAIRQLGGTPAPACTYDFKVTTVEDFIRGARSLANTAVQAYIGALPLLRDAQLRTTGAGVLAMQARLAAYLNLLTDAAPFPDPADAGRTMAQINSAISQFIRECPATPPPESTTTAVLGPKNLVTAQSEIRLDATGSTAAAGAGPLRYSVRLAPGSKTASIFDQDTALPRVQFSEGFGNYIFELTVTDARNNTAKDTATITYIGR